MSDTTQAWLDAAIEESEAQWAYLQSQELDDTFGWGAMIGALLDRIDSSYGTPKETAGNSCGLLLTGPQGCGKHTAAAHAMSLLHAKDHALFFLNGMDLASLGSAQCIENLEALLGSCADNDQPVCILLEEAEDCPFRRELLTYFGQQLRNYRLSDFPALFFILIDSREQDIPACLRSQLLLCRMSMPNRQQRSDFLARYAKDLRKALSLPVFAEATEGASYAQLLDMVAALNWLLDSKGLSGLSEEDLRAFLEGQMPAPTRESDLRQLARSAQELMEQLPQLLKDAAQAARSAVPATVAAPQPQAAPNPTQTPAMSADITSMSDRMKEIEAMPSRAIAADLFGGEAEVEKMRQEIASRLGNSGALMQ